MAPEPGLAVPATCSPWGPPALACRCAACDGRRAVFLENRVTKVKRGR